MSHVTMEISHSGGSHLHNGLPAFGGMGHMSIGSPGNSVPVTSEHTHTDDVDLDALINSMSTFPSYNEDRPLLESMENLTHIQAAAARNNNSANHGDCNQTGAPPGSKRGHGSLHVGRMIPKPKLDWAWRSKSTSDAHVAAPVAEHPKLKLSSSLPEQDERKKEAVSSLSLSSSSSSSSSGGDGGDVPNPFPLLKTMPAGSAVENLYFAQKSKDEMGLLSSDKCGAIAQVPIRICCEDGTSKLCEVHPSLTVQDVCGLMVNKMHTTDDRSWSLVEELPDVELERTLEDHELVTAICKSWTQGSNNKLHFRKDFRKYEIFQNPGQFFPEQMVVDEDDGSSPTLNIKRLKIPWLLDMLSTTNKIPEIQGYLHVKEGHKKSWKKTFFILRESGLYCLNKGNSKDPRHLNFCVQFNDVNIYQAMNAKKKFHAPTEYMFCTKPIVGKSELKDLRCFCAESERSRQCWLATMRLAKYGVRLRENYDSAMRRAAKNIGVLTETTKKDMKNSTERVAMDFSGNQGRVVDNPSEAIAIAKQEGFNWRKRGGQRTHDGPSLTSPRQPNAGSPRFVFNPLHKDTGNSQPSSPRHNGGSPRSGLGNANTASPGAHRIGGFSSGIHMTQPWFHSGLSREQTHDLFAKKGMVDGMFLIRESQRLAGAYVLSFSFNQKVKHYQINAIDSGGSVFYTIDDGNTKFTDLVQLVEFYMVNAVGLPTPLLYTCSTV